MEGLPEFIGMVGRRGIAGRIGRELLMRSGALWNSYGPTETTIWSMAGRVRAARDALALGRPISATSISDRRLRA